MDEILAMLYQLTEEGLPTQAGSWKKERMDDQLIDTMGRNFMEEYEKASYEEDHISRVDLFRYALALGIRLGSLSALW